MAKKEYGSESIQSQSELEAVRMYPNVYLGSNDLAGATQTIYEILANAVDEANSGFGNKICITIHKDNSVTISDNGRGVPMDLNKKEGKYAYELVFCKLHSGGKLKGSRSNYNSSAGQHGIGAAASNMTSKWMNVISKRDGYIYEVEFKEGVVSQKLKKTKDKDKKQITGTTISWLPDDTIFTDINFDFDELKFWIKSQAICSDNVEFVLIDERPEENKTETFKYENGILSYAKELLKEEDVLANITFVEASGKGKDQENRPEYTVKAKIAFAFSSKTKHYSFYHNSIPLPNGGAPKRAMQKAFLDYFKNEIKKINNSQAKDIEFDDIEENLICVISTTTQEPPSFENQTKKSISNKFIEDFLYNQIVKSLALWAKENPLEIEKVNKQISINIQSRKSAAVQRIATKQKLSGKLKLDERIKNYVDCRSKDPNERELFIAEGLSALGSLKQSRDSNTQALLAIRGKILNTLKVDYNSILKNDLIMDIMKLIGTGIDIPGNKTTKLGNFNIENRRFNKIIIATDQDSDGNHIISLCLTLFYKLTPELIKKGYIYFLETPLYEIQILEGKDKGKILYAFSDKEKDNLIKNRKCKISRNKGLGELSNETMSIYMSPKTRHLTQVTMKDVENASQILDLFMGNDSEPRRNYISLHGAEYADDLDVE